MSDDSSSSASVFRLSVHFSGRVQGVGFRYETLQIAKGFDVTGFVKNLPDGRVQLEVEGEKAEVTAFVQQVEDDLASFIRETEKCSEQGEPRFFNFTIQ
ncbi:MAG TPA: acylphosphatase [Opitutales bacterium]|nr:acylphosphatase [Opitutales bacterium]